MKQEKPEAKPEKGYKIKNDILITNDGLELVIYVESAKKFVFLNRTAKEIFDMAGMGLVIKEIQSAFADRYKLNNTKAGCFVESTIKSLLENAVLEKA